MDIQNRPPSGSLTKCLVCLDLIPNHHTTQWKFNVAENLTIESTLPFKISELDVSSQLCVLCSVIKDGIGIMRNGALKAKLRGGMVQKEAVIIVQINAPVEVKILCDGGNEKDFLRMQFFVKDGKCRSLLTSGDPPCFDYALRKVRSKARGVR
jgi:hypothetical protein